MVVFLLFFGKRSLFAAFIRKFAVGMITFKSLVAGVSLYRYLGTDMCFTFFKQPEIMLSPFFYLYTKYFSASFINDDLCFQCVLFLFPRIILPLLF